MARRQLVTAVDVLSVFLLVLAAGFPFAALIARRRSVQTLWIITGGALVLFLSLALVLGTSWAGNRLVETEGYRYVAVGLLRMALGMFVFPTLLTAFAVALLGNRASAWWSYPVALVTMLAGLLTGLVALLWTPY